MTLAKKGIRVVALIRAVRSAGEIVPGDKVQILHEQPATYVGPAAVEDGIQMHKFWLFDGMEVPLEVPALTAALTTSLVTTPQPVSVGRPPGLMDVKMTGDFCTR